MNTVRRITLVGIMSSLAGCTLVPPNSVSTPPPTPQLLTFGVVGYCTTKEGTLTSQSSGFTPNGPYTTVVFYPNGKPYPGLTNPGKASEVGSTPNWIWPCEGDPAGTYTATLTDNTTGNTITAKFVVHKPKTS